MSHRFVSPQPFHQSHQPHRHGGLLGLIGLIVVLLIGIGIGIAYIGGGDTVRTEVERIVGPSAVQGTVIAVMETNEGNFVSVRFDDDVTYAVHDVFSVRVDGKELCKVRVERVTNDKNYISRILEDTWAANAERSVPQGARVVAAPRPR